MWMTKNQKLLPSAFQKLADQRGSPKRVWKLPRPTKLWRALDAAEEREVEGGEERDDHDGGVDEDRRGEEHRDMPADRACGRPSGPLSGWQTAPPGTGGAGVRLTSADRTSLRGRPEAAARRPRGSRCRGSRWREAPQVSFSRFGRAARQDLVGRADGRLARLAPGDELLRQRILERHRPRSTAGRSRAARWRRARRTPASRPIRGRSWRRRRSARRRSARCAMSTWSEM